MLDLQMATVLPGRTRAWCPSALIAATRASVLDCCTGFLGGLALCTQVVEAVVAAAGAGVAALRTTYDRAPARQISAFTGRSRAESSMWRKVADIAKSLPVVNIYTLVDPELTYVRQSAIPAEWA
jgi:hypothetical protein